MKTLVWILVFSVLSVFRRRSDLSVGEHRADKNGGNECFFRAICFGAGASWTWRPLITKSTPTSAPAMPGSTAASTHRAVCLPATCYRECWKCVPLGRGELRRFMVFGAPTFLFGKTIPQTLYTWSPDAIGIEHSWGVGIYIAKGFEFRVTQHFLFDRLGARDTNLDRPTRATTGLGDANQGRRP